MEAGEWLYLCVAHGNDGATEVFYFYFLILLLVIAMGNPRVSQALPGPQPGKTSTPALRYGFFQVGVPGFDRFCRVLMGQRVYSRGIER